MDRMRRRWLERATIKWSGIEIDVSAVPQLVKSELDINAANGKIIYVAVEPIACIYGEASQAWDLLAH